jgi:hypothetical protein
MTKQLDLGPAPDPLTCSWCHGTLPPEPADDDWDAQEEWQGYHCVRAHIADPVLAERLTTYPARHFLMRAGFRVLTLQRYPIAVMQQQPADSEFRDCVMILCCSEACQEEVSQQIMLHNPMGEA